MKKNASILSTIALAALLTGLPGCEAVDDPETAIVGRWELTADGHDDDHLQSITQPDGSYIEFLPDGRHMIFSAANNLLIDFSYKMDGNRLNIYSGPDNPGNDRIWKYKFLNRNKLQLTYVEGLISTIMNPTLVYVYRRTE